jgi:hypothetical protein
MQQYMMNQDNSLRFWSDVTTKYKTYQNVMFEIFNEPNVDTTSFDYNHDWWEMWRRGGMSVGRYQVVVSRDTGATADNWVPWSTAGMQQAIDAIRGVGATNVCLVGGWGFAGDASGMYYEMPIDPLNQTAVNGHFYSPLGGSGLPSVVSNYPVIDGLHAKGYAIMFSESGR